MKYRPEIDGLRAVALIPVILFHAGSARFSGGFVGVDVFFVISGYLITTIIVSDLLRGRFTLVGFYERRARRILPALFLVLACCLPLAWLWLWPDELKQLAESLVAVSLFCSNVFFWNLLTATGYFDSANELKPLLHTWSLAIEEQFYVFFPLFLMLSWRLGRKWIISILAACGLFSIALAQYRAPSHPVSSFYFLQTRAWELALGSLVAFYMTREGRLDVLPRASQVLSVLGLMMLAYAVFAYGPLTPFPGLYALVPTCGTGLIIVFAQPGTWVHALLRSRLLVGIGLVSYSAYLWHQPLFAFARCLSLENPGASVYLALTGAAFALAYLSWRFVERPFRQAGRISRRAIFVAAAVGTLVFVSIGVVGVYANGFPGRHMLPAQIARTFERAIPSDACFDNPDVDSRPDWLCLVGDETSEPSFLLVGDSHASALLQVFDEVASSRNQAGLFAGANGCPPLVDVHELRGEQNERNCYLLNRRIIEFVKSRRIKKVILAGRWTRYTDGNYEGDDLIYLGLSAQDVRSKQRSRAAFEHGVGATASLYESSGADVYLIEQVPLQQYPPRDIYRHAYQNGRIARQVLERYSVSIAKHLSFKSYVTDVFKKDAPGFKMISLDDLFCSGAKCLVGDESGSYYVDASHLSVYGAKLAAQRVADILSRAP